MFSVSKLRMGPVAAASIMAAGAASAKTITVPDVLTVTATGTVRADTDSLDLFGGGDLAGLPFTEVFTIVDTLKPFQQSFTLTGLSSDDASVTLTIDGHSYTLSGPATAADVYLGSGASAFDERYVSLTSAAFPQDDASASVARIPPQWGADPAAMALFQADTVSGQDGYGVGSRFVVSNSVHYLPGSYTGMLFDINSISTAYTVTTASIPEPATWGMMLLGAGMIGVGSRIARRKNLMALTAA